MCCVDPPPHSASQIKNKEIKPICEFYPRKHHDSYCNRNLNLIIVNEDTDRFAQVFEVCPKNENLDPNYPLGLCETYERDALVLYVFSEKVFPLRISFLNTFR